MQTPAHIRYDSSPSVEKGLDTPREGWWWRRSRRVKILIATLVALLIVALAVGLGIGISQANRTPPPISSSTASSARPTAGSLTVRQVFTTCASQQACVSDTSGMSTLIVSLPDRGPRPTRLMTRLARARVHSLLPAAVRFLVSLRLARGVS